VHLAEWQWNVGIRPARRLDRNELAFRLSAPGLCSDPVRFDAGLSPDRMTARAAVNSFMMTSR